MLRSTTRQLIYYRTWIVAIANAAITWVILIIAPLGLFAVILCTAIVFISSLSIGWLCDRALFSLLQDSDSTTVRVMQQNDLNHPSSAMEIPSKRVDERSDRR